MDITAVPRSRIQFAFPGPGSRGVCACSWPRNTLCWRWFRSISRKGEHLSNAFGAINPHHTVPVLELDYGTRLLDSNSTSLYLDKDLSRTEPDGQQCRGTRCHRHVAARHGPERLRCHRRRLPQQRQGLRNRALPGAIDYEQISEAHRARPSKGPPVLRTCASDYLIDAIRTFRRLAD
jgi:hypothetical protein